MPVQALLFDKDGTLFDFNETWNAWTRGVIHHYAGGDDVLAAHIAQTIAFDLEAGAFHPSSPIIAGTNREAAELVALAIGEADVDAVEDYLAISATQAPLAEAAPLVPLMTRFREQGLKLGVVTNDTQMGAEAHLNAAGAFDLFDFVIGHDSGFGAKPDSDPLRAFAQKVGVAVDQVVMVGDSTHDLIAGQRAGMQTIGVLTGMADAATLAPHADLVLPDIGYIPDWLKRA